MSTDATILIIDDELNLRTTLSAILKRGGYRVSTAEGAQEALQILKASHFDLVFLDLRMPGMDGLQLLPEILHFYPEMPVLILTANASLDTAIQTLSMGAYGYLLKPLDPEQILSRVEDVMREQEQVRRRRELVNEIQGILNDLKHAET